MLQTARIVPLVLFVSVLIAGCSQNDLGRYCFVGAEGGDNSNTATFLKILNLEAPECGERLCLKQGGYVCTGELENCTEESGERLKLQPMCTMECSKNSDCEKSDETVNYNFQSNEEQAAEAEEALALDLWANTNTEIEEQLKIMIMGYKS